LGGVINVIPRRGGEGAFNPRLEAMAGSFGALAGTLAADGSLGVFHYAVTADGFASDGYDIVPKRIATHTGEGDGADMTTLTGVFDLAATSALSIDLLLRQRDARADYDPGFFGNIVENPDAEIRQNDTALWRLGATWTPNASTSLRLSGGALETDRVTTELGITGDQYHGDRAFADAVATRTLHAWTLTLGAQMEDEQIDAVSFGSAVVGEQQHWGAYAGAQGEFHGLDITAALRRDDIDGFGAHTTWRAGVSYRLGETARLYAAYGTSYRAPSLYERFVPFFGAAGLDPEEAESWEIGADAELPLFDRRNGAQVTVLYRSSDIENLIGFSGFSYANVDRAAIDFAEARLTLRPTDWLTARMSYANTDARDTSTGEPLQRRPRHAWSAALEAQHGPLSAEISWRQVGARRDATYDDLGFFDGVARVEAYDVIGASASWAMSESVKLYAAADNVLDERYEPVNGFAGAPASFTIGVRIRPDLTRYRARRD
jgi:vitamin B12 transporter